MKNVSRLFLILAVILSDVMCAVVAYSFCDMQWGIKYAGYSAPASVAFLYAIPYGIGIAICIVISVKLKNKDKNMDAANQK